ncbi:MAG: multicopper oxidase domain-containing protein, partial [Gemmatimonadaceae bacterium]
MHVRHFLVIGALVASGGFLAAARYGGDEAPLCNESSTTAPTSNAMRPSRDLYCMELLARPGAGDAGGTLQLGRATSPFDVSLTVDGSQRYNVTAQLHDLPPPSSLGPYSAYVAWVSPPSLTPTRRLGVVRNGRTALGEIALDKFLVFVSAERSADASEQRGKVVLRGLSPSIRMQQHSMELGGNATIATSHQEHEGHTSSLGDSTVEPRWFMPPHHPGQRMRAMPGVDDLVPEVAPFLPGAGVDVRTIPIARPRTLMRLERGDTLQLSASLVRRTINGRQLVMYGYNGQYPGPLLQVSQGATIHVRFKNDLDMPSAVHWHGVRLENASDGAVGVTQDAVKSGERFDYTVHFRDEGIYW